MKDLALGFRKKSKGLGRVQAGLQKNSKLQGIAVYSHGPTGMRF